MVRIKSKTRTHLQSFEDFVDRQKLDPEKDFKEIQEYFLMTLHDLARQWFTCKQNLHLMMR